MPHDDSRPPNLVSPASLPPAAQTWLNKALPKNFEFSNSIQIQQEGSLEIRGHWTDFKARGVYNVSPFPSEQNSILLRATINDKILYCNTFLSWIR